jgi:predicted transcriptional regulator
MPNRATIKIGPEIDAKLYKEFVAIAKKNGQSQRFLLEKAIEHYIRNVVPSQNTVRPEVMEAFRRSNAKFRDLYRKLAE